MHSTNTERMKLTSCPVKQRQQTGRSLLYTFTFLFPHLLLSSVFRSSCNFSALTRLSFGETHGDASDPLAEPSSDLLCRRSSINFSACQPTRKQSHGCQWTMKNEILYKYGESKQTKFFNLK